MLKHIFLSVSILTSFSFPALTGEGMWIPLLVDSMNYGDMQKNGFRLSAEDIYNANHESLKDAVVIFGGGCTGAVISADGLVITNHHCGFSRIQSHSTIENNYLANGFWAGSKQEELSNPGLTVTFLVYIQDVTKDALQGTAESMPEGERIRNVAENINTIELNAIAGTHYSAKVKPFYFGKEYYLFVYEVFTDVRLVGTPPEAIGRFGGDTDNWNWPRHTGDFSLFRIYADKDNHPADYSTDNIPYKPRKSLKIWTGGVKEGDFTMVLGYPGRTDEYLVSDGLEMIGEKLLPAKIEMRTLRLNALQEEMNKGPEEHLKYVSQSVNISNAWKKWIGVTKGLRRSGALESKELQEMQFEKWASAAADDPHGYSTLMNRFRTVYDVYEPLYLANDLGNEFLNSFKSFDFASRAQIMIHSSMDSSKKDKAEAIQKLNKSGAAFFHSAYLNFDRKIMAEFLRIYADATAPEFHPPVFKRISQQYQNDYVTYTDELFAKSVFTDSVKYSELLKKTPAKISKAMLSDPVMVLYRDFGTILTSNVYGKIDSLNLVLNNLYRSYISGLMAMDPGRKLYPDANFTMRLTYGKIEGYSSADAVNYNYMTTLDGVMEKEDPYIEDYHVTQVLKEKFKAQDYGNYAENGKMPVCLIASNHTSGGNSGSPVLNGNGALIGINFDRNWEGTMSDYLYNPQICRNILLDVRFVLFVIEKIGKAPWIIDELSLISD